jgi:NADH-quinone oxidoreductase subunit C
MTTQREVAKAEWKSQAADMRQTGFVRCEWLTATHNGGDSFEISLMLSKEDLSESVILSTNAEGSIDSVSEIYPAVEFHEREVAQMFGLEFVGLKDLSPAFEIELSGFPMRRDFALATRAGSEWPGAVEPDENAKRRPSLPPGVLPEWTS